MDGYHELVDVETLSSYKLIVVCSGCIDTALGEKLIVSTMLNIDFIYMKFL